MSTITIPKKEYKELLGLKSQYERLRRLFEKGLFSAPPIKESNSVVLSFRKTGRYNEKFLKSLERGLKRSAYFKK